MFDQDTADRICQLLTEGMSLRAASIECGVAPSSVLYWKNIPEFAEQYARAREIGYSFLADEILEISDETLHDTIEGDEKRDARANAEWISRSKLRVDSRKWILSKMLPKVYGDKLDLNHSGSVKVIQATELTSPEERAAAWKNP